MSPDKKNAIVTGAYGAIGQAICAGLAANGYNVTLVGRDASNLEKTRSWLMHHTGNQHISSIAIDLSSQKEIREISRKWKGPLHLLINNVATAPRRRTETPDGIEMQWATNVLAYFWMTSYFHPFLTGSTDARIVNVASYWAGGLNLDDPEFKRRPYDNDVAYRQAKQANRMLSAAFAERLVSAGIRVNSCHPGDVNSKLSNAFGFGGSESPDQGAATPLFLARSDKVRDITGKYFEHLKEIRCSFSSEKNKVDALFHLCEQSLPESEKKY